MTPTVLCECPPFVSTNNTGIFHSPNYPLPYPPNALCAYTVNVPRDGRVKFILLDADLERYFDNLILFDGPDCLSRRIAAVDRRTEEVFITTRNYLFVLFISNPFTKKRGFQAQFEQTNAQSTVSTIAAPTGLLRNCGGEIVSAEGTIAHTTCCERSVLCIWRINGEPGHTVELRITKFKTANGADFLQILDGADCSAREIRWLHDKPTWPQNFVQSTSNALTLILRSMGEMVDFEATYSLTHNLFNATTELTYPVDPGKLHTTINETLPSETQETTYDFAYTPA
ncbi:unnamed protein product [Dicrocoelium dendriticum]|nr:unnamed protein product [Dicrocoelium dendriticum]